MGKINSRAKGAAFERKIANILKERGFPSAHRGQQFSGTPDSPDVKCDELKEFGLELKAVENININKAYEQSLKDSGKATPIVIYKKNNKPILVVMELHDWIDLVQFAKGKIDDFNKRKTRIWNAECGEYLPVGNSYARTNEREVRADRERDSDKSELL